MSFGFSYIIFVVWDFDKMFEILRGVLKGCEVYFSGDDIFLWLCEKFFLVGDVWFVIMEGEFWVECSYNYVVFKIDDVEFDDCLVFVEWFGLDCKLLCFCVVGEGCLIYFYDYDNYLFELYIGMLEMWFESYWIILDEWRIV